MNHQLSNSNDPIVKNNIIYSNKIFKKLKFSLISLLNNILDLFKIFRKTSNILSYFYTPINELSNSNDPILFRNNLNIIYSNKVFKKLKFYFYTPINELSTI